MPNPAVPSTEISHLSYSSNQAQQNVNIRVEHLQNPPGQGNYLYQGGPTLFISLTSRPLHYLNLKLEDLAQLLDISQFHFSRLFKTSMGLSPYQYLIQQRIERAKQLLKQTDQSIVDIAFNCGFNSHSHLSKQFRQVTGITPKAYRMN